MEISGVAFSQHHELSGNINLTAWHFRNIMNLTAWPFRNLASGVTFSQHRELSGVAFSQHLLQLNNVTVGKQGQTGAPRLLS